MDAATMTPGPAASDLVARVLGDFGAWSALIALVTLGFTLIFSMVQVRGVKRAERAQMFLDLSQRWTATYDHRQAVMKITAPDKIVAAYGSDYRLLLESDHWKHIRPLLNLFETIGLLVYRGYVNPADIFVLVSVDNFPDPAGPNDPSTGLLLEKMRPFIAHLRRHYRHDIYVFYDRFLLPEYAARRPLVPRRPWWPGRPRWLPYLGRERRGPLDDCCLTPTPAPAPPGP